MKHTIVWSGIFIGGAIVGFAFGWLIRSGVWAPTVGGELHDEIQLTFSATIDGSDRFIFTPDNVWNDHGKWQPPQDVLFNNEPWNDFTQPPPGWPELAATLNLAGARLLKREGRDIIVLEKTTEGFDLYFADTPMGAGKYVVTVLIPKM